MIRRNRRPLQLSCLILVAGSLAACDFLRAPAAAVEIMSSPTIGPSNNGLLSRVLNVSTDVPTRPSFRVLGPNEAWTIESDVLQADHAIPLFGFTFSSQYTIDQLQLTDASGNTMTVDDPLTISTAPPPSNLPTINVKTSIPSQMEPGYTFFPAGGGHTLAVDANGTPRWHYFGSGADIHQAANGYLLARVNDSIREFDFLGASNRAWHATGDVPAQLLSISQPVEAGDFHHDASLIESSGNVLTLEQRRRMVDNFPLSDTDPNAFGPVELISDAVLEIATDGTVVHRWDLADILDPTRGSYGLFNNAPDVADWSHANAVFHDPRDDSIIVSVRNQDSTIKFERTTGELKWILGPHQGWGPEFEQYLLTPVGDDFEWPYHTHAPMLLPNGNLMVHDNGNFRARPFDPALENSENYTRGAVEFAINEDTMEVSQVWQYGKDAEETLYSPIVGDADWQPETDNVLMTFGFPFYVDGESQSGNVKPRIIEVNRSGQVVFDLEFSNPDGSRLIVYRAERIPSLYGPDYTMTMLPLLLAAGDYNGNGRVEQGDLDLVLLNWGQDAGAVPESWVHDLPSGTIDQEELDLVLINWGNTSSIGAAAAVPEPETWLIGLVAAASAWLLWRRQS